MTANTVGWKAILDFTTRVGLPEAFKSDLDYDHKFLLSDDAPARFYFIVTDTCTTIVDYADVKFGSGMMADLAKRLTSLYAKVKYAFFDGVHLKTWEREELDSFLRHCGDGSMQGVQTQATLLQTAALESAYCNEETLGAAYELVWSPLPTGLSIPFWTYFKELKDRGIDTTLVDDWGLAHLWWLDNLRTLKGIVIQTKDGYFRLATADTPEGLTLRQMFQKKLLDGAKPDPEFRSISTLGAVVNVRPMMDVEKWALGLPEGDFNFYMVICFASGAMLYPAYIAPDGVTVRAANVKGHSIDSLKRLLVGQTLTEIHLLDDGLTTGKLVTAGMGNREVQEYDLHDGAGFYGLNPDGSSFFLMND